MSTYELQVYKTGIWNVDSYFDDRDLALSEADKLDLSGKHLGVRILQEDYDEGSNISSCRVIFSKMRQSGETEDWRATAKRSSSKAGGAHAGHGGDRPRRRRQSPGRKKKTSLYIIFGIGLVVVIGGAIAMMGLHEIAEAM